MIDYLKKLNRITGGGFAAESGGFVRRAPDGSFVRVSVARDGSGWVVGWHRADGVPASGRHFTSLAAAAAAAR